MQCLEANPVAAYCTEDTGDIKVVKGGADRALGSFADNSNTGHIPLIMEAKPDGSATMDMTQLLVYMAAVREATKSQANRIVFEIVP